MLEVDVIYFILNDMKKEFFLKLRKYIATNISVAYISSIFREKKCSPKSSTNLEIFEGWNASL